MGRLSTHVLDIATGKPARGVAIELLRLQADGSWQRIATAQTNNDGRTDEPLMSGDSYRVGTYLLNFRIGEYFRRGSDVQAPPAFLDIVPLRFTIAEDDGHYHVPLLASPWSYSTYRGS